MGKQVNVKYIDKNVNWIEPGNWNKIEVIKTDGEDNGEESGKLENHNSRYDKNSENSDLKRWKIMI